MTLSNILFAAFVLAMLFPQSRMFIQSNIQRLFLRPPSTEVKVEMLSSKDLEYTLRDPNGRVVSLQDLSDKPIFLNYWATWCPPCVAEMPSIEKLYADYKDKVHFLIVSNEDPAKTKAFMEKKDYHFPLSTSLEAAPEILQSNSIPATFLISKDGGILISEVGANNWNSGRVRELIDSDL